MRNNTIYGAHIHRGGTGDMTSIWNTDMANNNPSFFILYMPDIDYAADQKYSSAPFICGIISKENKCYTIVLDLIIEDTEKKQLQFVAMKQDNPTCSDFLIK